MKPERGLSFIEEGIDLAEYPLAWHDTGIIAEGNYGNHLVADIDAAHGQGVEFTLNPA